MTESRHFDEKSVQFVLRFNDRSLWPRSNRVRSPSKEPRGASTAGEVGRKKLGARRRKEKRWRPRVERCVVLKQSKDIIRRVDGCDCRKPTCESRSQKPRSSLKRSRGEHGKSRAFYDFYRVATHGWCYAETYSEIECSPNVPAVFRETTSVFLADDAGLPHRD